MKTQNTPKSSKNAFAVAALRTSLRASAPAELRLLPAGRFKARDGRPHEVPEGWLIDADVAARLIARANLRSDDAVIDYEHQTLYSEKNGQPAPAAGWFSPKSLEWRADGLYATDVRWTATAELSIAQDEYRYLSPVIEYNPSTGEVLGVAMAAITNYAAVDGLDGLAQRAALKFNFSNHPQEHDVNREQLIALLGLAEDATDEQITAALTDMKAKSAEAVEAAAEVEALKTQVAALKATPNHKAPDPAKYAPVGVVEALKADLAALKAEQVNAQVTALVDEALADGKLLPAQKDWATDLGNGNLAALKSYLAATPAIAALSGTQTGGQAPAGAEGRDVTLQPGEVVVMKQLGLSKEAYLKAKTQEQE